MMFTILAAIAEYEREMIRMRLGAGLERARRYGSKSGKPLHRPPKPIDERKMKMLYVESGWGIRRLAREFRVSPHTIKARLKKMGVYKGNRSEHGWT